MPGMLSISGEKHGNRAEGIWSHGLPRQEAETNVCAQRENKMSECSAQLTFP